jgi:hypothetical protein
MGELSVLENTDNIMDVVKSGDREALMALIGQGETEEKPKTGLSRLNINYDTDDDEGNTLKKGTWKVYHDGEFVYADSVTFRPMMRTYEWSVYDADENKFACRSTQEPKLEHQFPDTTGGNKCGRISKSEEQELGDDHPKTLASKLATCNQVFYATITMNGKTGDGRDVKIENLPVVAYFKRSGFRPAKDAIDKLPKGTLMSEQIFELTTKRHKMGSVTYFTPVFTPVKTVKMAEEDFELTGTFVQTVAASNHRILEQHKEALKNKASEEEVDLAADFN